MTSTCEYPGIANRLNANEWHFSVENFFYTSCTHLPSYEHTLALCENKPVEEETRRRRDGISGQGKIHPVKIINVKSLARVNK